MSGQTAIRLTHPTGRSFLSPQDLRHSASGMRRVLLIGSCTAEILHSKFDLDCEVDFILTNNYAELGEPPRPIEDYDLQIIQLPLRSLLWDTELWERPYTDAAAHKRLFEEVCTRLSMQLNAAFKWGAKYNILTFVSNFLVPMQNHLGRLLPRYDFRNSVYFIEKLNEHLDGEVSARSNCFVLDVDKISAAMGRGGVQEDVIGWLAHGAVMPLIMPDPDRIEPARELSAYYPATSLDFMAGIWAEVDAMYRTVRQVDQVKMVVIDLDDTLWSGTLGDTDDPGPQMVEHKLWPMGVIEALHVLKKRGVLLGVISKNDESRVREVWGEILGWRLSLDDFAVVKINWRPKTQNMQEILEVANLLPKSVVFVDDNPVERAAMQAEFPDLRLLDGAHYFWKRALIWGPELEVAFVSDESAQKTGMIQAQVVREESRATAPSREQFLNSLSLKIEIIEIKGAWDKRLNRVVELINKTNQFNTTGERWPLEKLAAALGDGLQIFAFKAEDKFSAYGLVGAALIQGDAIVQYVMSCRVAGLDIETTFVSVLCEFIRTRARRRPIAIWKETGANRICRDLYAKCGFVQEGEIWLAPNRLGARAAHILVSGALAGRD
jgi:FkbH-like protein